MKVRVKHLLIILILCAGNVNAQTELDNYLKIAAENNPGIRSLFLDYNAALEKIPQVGTLPNLNVSFGYFIQPIETRVGPQRAKLGISQMFPWYGTLDAQEDVLVEAAKAKYERFEDAKSKLFFDVKSVYYNYYFIKKGIEITQENLEILNTFKQLAIIKVETGKVSVVDELRVELEINELDNNLIFLEDSKWTLEIEFNRLLNDSINYNIITPDVLWEDDLELQKQVLLDSITNQNHLIKELEHRMLSWQNQEKVGHKVGLPSFVVGLDYAFIGKSDNTSLGKLNGRDAIMPMVGISIPLYRKKYKGIINEALLKIESIENKKIDKQNQLTILFERSYRDYSDANRRIDLYKKQFDIAEQSLNILIVSYSADGKNFEEVLRMERKVLKYALELDKARADKNVAAAFINYLTGK
tara:strand:+ start:17821 stop:19062 length:1242 start_codon:yes stop_codon:yes gene_type:complete